MSSPTPTTGFAPLNVSRDTIHGGAFSLALDSASGLPSQIRRGKKEILAGPIALEIGGRRGLTDGASRALAQPKLVGPGRASWEANWTQGGLQLSLTGSADFDGFVDIAVSVANRNSNAVAAGVSLDIPLHRSIAKFMMGLGRHGGFTPPADLHWSWASFPSVTGYQVWAGQVDAGLRLKLKGSDRELPTNRLTVMNCFRDRIFVTLRSLCSSQARGRLRSLTRSRHPPPLPAGATAAPAEHRCCTAAARPDRWYCAPSAATAA